MGRPFLTASRAAHPFFTNHTPESREEELLTTLIPGNLTTRECLIVHEVLQRIKQRVLEGHPSGQVIDQALTQTVEQGTCRPPV